MTNREDLEDAVINVQSKEDAVENYKHYEKVSKTVFKAGLIGLAYIGTRQFIGPDFADSLNEHMPSVIYLVDSAATIFTLFSAVCGRLDYRLNHSKKNKFEKELRIEKYNLNETIEAYLLDECGE